MLILLELQWKFLVPSRMILKLRETPIQYLVTSVDNPGTPNDTFGVAIDILEPQADNSGYFCTIS